MLAVKVNEGKTLLSGTVYEFSTCPGLKRDVAQSRDEGNRMSPNFYKCMFHDNKLECHLNVTYFPA